MFILHLLLECWLNMNFLSRTKCDIIFFLLFIASFFYPYFPISLHMAVKKETEQAKVAEKPEDANTWAAH